MTEKIRKTLHSCSAEMPLEETAAFNKLIDYYRSYVCSFDVVRNIDEVKFIINRIEGALEVMLILNIIDDQEYLRIYDTIYSYRFEV